MGTLQRSVERVTLTKLKFLKQLLKLINEIDHYASCQRLGQSMFLYEKFNLIKINFFLTSLIFLYKYQVSEMLTAPRSDLFEYDQNSFTHVLNKDQYKNRESFHFNLLRKYNAANLIKIKLAICKLTTHLNRYF